MSTSNITKLIRPLVVLCHISELEDGIIQKDNDHYVYIPLLGEWIFGYAKINPEDIPTNRVLTADPDYAVKTNLFVRGEEDQVLTCFSQKWKDEFGFDFTDTKFHFDRYDWTKFFLKPSPEHFFGLHLGYSQLNSVFIDYNTWTHIETNRSVWGPAEIIVQTVIGQNIDNCPSFRNAVIALRDVFRSMPNHPTHTNDLLEKEGTPCEHGLLAFLLYMLTAKNLIITSRTVYGSWPIGLGVLLMFFVELITKDYE